MERYVEEEITGLGALAVTAAHDDAKKKVAVTPIPELEPFYCHGQIPSTKQIEDVMAELSVERTEFCDLATPQERRLFSEFIVVYSLAHLFNGVNRWWCFEFDTYLLVKHNVLCIKQIENTTRFQGIWKFLATSKPFVEAFFLHTGIRSIVLSNQVDPELLQLMTQTKGSIWSQLHTQDWIVGQIRFRSIKVESPSRTVTWEYISCLSWDTYGKVNQEKLNYPQKVVWKPILTAIELPTYHEEDKNLTFTQEFSHVYDHEPINFELVTCLRCLLSGTPPKMHGCFLPNLCNWL